nr:MAG TPA_asm: hypothetical protein [Bacteriophage sp.]
MYMSLELYAHINTCPISLPGFTPVDHSSQIQKSVSDWNICNVNRPCLIWCVYNGITK